MLHFRIDRALLEPMVPPGTVLDLYHDTEAWVSVVAFRFLDTRVLGVAVPFHRDFTEVNLRFYVRRHVNGETRRGVTFIRELVPRAAIAWAARLTFNEPYVTTDVMREMLPEDGGMAGRLRYEWMHRNRWQSLEVHTERGGHAMANGSIEEFLTVRDWGYTRQDDGGTLEYRVEHPRWMMWKSTKASLDCDPATICGFDFTLPLAPTFAYACDGSPVTIYVGEKLAQ